MPQPPHDLRPSERPMRSDFARSEFTLEKAYARRRLVTLGVIVLVLCAVIYGVKGHHASGPAEIPTIAAADNLKQKPASPGGIDIPHQDVQVYDQLEGKNTPVPQVEHLLPPPEVPRDVPHTVPAASPPSSLEASTASKPAVATTAAPTVASVVPSAPVPMAAPVPAAAPESPVAASPLGAPTAAPVLATTATQNASAAAVKSVAPTAVSPTPVTANPVANAAPQSLTIEQLIKNNSVGTVSASASTVVPTPTAPPLPVIAPKTAATTPPPAIVSGSFAVQLASVQGDSAKAQSMMRDLQSKYAAQLGRALLHVVPATLGSRGVFYRIQSQGLSEDTANQICSSLKKISAGCILVRK